MQFKYPLFKIDMPGEVMQELEQVLFSGWIAEGERVKEFERHLGYRIDNPLVLATHSCTGGIMLALRALGIKPGDEIISTPITAPATNLPILDIGARIVWADCDPTTGNISPVSIEACITPKTRAIMVVHWGGVPADMRAINALAKEHGLVVIEDAAHALGATYRERPIGSLSDIAIFSFQAVKLITSGDGGAVAFKDSSLYEKAKRMRWFGIDRDRKGRLRRIDEVDIHEVGLKFHMNDITAAIGLSQLGQLDRVLCGRRRAADFYFDRLKNIDGLMLLEISSESIPSWWVYTILAEDREALIDKLIAHGIQATPVVPRNDRLSVMRNIAAPPPLPNVDYFADRMLCIPNGHWLCEDDLEFIAATIRTGW